jgi:hypothetical protein
MVWWLDRRSEEGRCRRLLGLCWGFSDISDRELSEMSEISYPGETRSARSAWKIDRFAHETGKNLYRDAPVRVEFGSGSAGSDVSPCACGV